MRYKIKIDGKKGTQPTGAVWNWFPMNAWVCRTKQECVNTCKNLITDTDLILHSVYSVIFFATFVRPYVYPITFVLLSYL